MTNDVTKLSLFPLTTKINDSGHLYVGGCDAIALCHEFGTPLYLFDEYTIRQKCQEFKRSFSRYFSDISILYASKAFLNRTMASIIKEEKLGLDVVSGGELYIAHSVGFPMDKVYFHGNNKSPQELEMALEWNIGHIVVDNFYEINLLERLTKGRETRQDVLLRLTPDVDPHTHQYTTTGTLDSKFGFPVNTGYAEEAVRQVMANSNLNLRGLAFHLGSPIFKTQPYKLAIEVVLSFAQKMKEKYGFQASELDIGGGFAVQYIREDKAPSIDYYAQAISKKLSDLLLEMKINPLQLTIEAGRAIISQAGIALYTTGAIKNIPGVRKYVCVDGGMNDNVRPPLYGAKYEALIANRATAEEDETVTIAGKLCESGDVLVRDVNLPSVASGDIISIPMCGAYSLPMASNYHALPRPAVVMVREGKAHLIRRRESYQDLVALDT